MPRKSSSFSIFLVAAISAIVLLFFCLRLYFNQAWLEDNISIRMGGSSFSNEVGEASVLPNGNLKVGRVFPEKSNVFVEGLEIPTKLYHSLSVQFSDKPSQQSLLLTVKTINPKSTNSKAILYANKSKSSLFLIDEIAPLGSTITSVSLSTPKLIDHYSINYVEFIPKKINTLDFIKLIQYDIDQIFKSHELQKHLLMPAYKFILAYVVCLLFSLLSMYTLMRRNKFTIGWMTLISVWFALDVIFMCMKMGDVSFSIDSYKDIFESIFSLSPWVLGTVICLFSFKRRYGLGILVIGSGYVVGAFLTAIIIIVMQYYQYEIRWNMIWGAEVILAFILLYFWRPQNCSIDEFRLEKAPPNRDYFFTFLLAAMGIIHLILITNRLAEDFSLIDVVNKSFKSSEDISFLTNNQISQWIQIHLQSVTNKPLSLAFAWSGLLAALGCVTFGGLRYLGVALLPAMISCYAVLSLPFWFEFSVIEINYANALAILCTSLFLILTVSIFCFKEFRLLTSLIPVLFVFSFDFSTYADFLSGNLQVMAERDLLINLVPIEPSIFSVLLNRSYILLPIMLASLAIWLLSSKRNDNSRCVNSLLCLCIITLCLPLYGIIHLATNNEISLLIIDYALLIFCPVACLVPACVYQAVTKDDETLPII